MTKAVATIEEVGKQIDTIIDKCLPITSKQAHGFNEALVLAGGIKAMRDIFLNNDGIKENIEAMANTPLGFMTDRSPEALASSKKQLKPYTYHEIAECCIEAMLQGYRITGNEFNIIAGRFYPAKNGKYRKIIENEEISSFFFTTTSPAFATETRMNYGKPDTVSIAKVQCFASWMQNNTSVKIGYDEDKLVFKIKVNAFMGDDGVIGKALSKLFSRVLMRIEGIIIPESTDIDGAQVILDDEPSQESLKDRLQTANRPNPLHQAPEWAKYKEACEIDPDLAAQFPEPTTIEDCVKATDMINRALDEQNA